MKNFQAETFTQSIQKNKTNLDFESYKYFLVIFLVFFTNVKKVFISRFFIQLFSIVNVLFCFNNVSFAQSQSWLLHQGSNTLLISNIEKNETHIITTGFAGKLVGYEMIQDSICCFSESRGNISRYYYALKNIMLPSCSRPYKTYSDQRNIQEYYFDSLKLLVYKYCLVLCKQQNFIWAVGNKQDKCPTCTGEDTSALIYLRSINPVLAPDARHLLYDAGKASLLKAGSEIFEIDIATGKELSIIKGRHPQYDVSGNYILYRANYSDIYLIYDRRLRKKKENFYENAFWLYKK